MLHQVNITNRHMLPVLLAGDAVAGDTGTFSTITAPLPAQVDTSHTTKSQ
jgi:hypothetical protein